MARSGEVFCHQLSLEPSALDSLNLEKNFPQGIFGHHDLRLMGLRDSTVDRVIALQTLAQA